MIHTSIFKKPRLMASLVALASITTACTWVKENPGSEAVAVRQANEVGACKMLGTASAQTSDRVLIINRRDKKVSEEILTLARNEAVKMKGNAIVAKGEPVEGEQAFAVYRCP